MLKQRKANQSKLKRFHFFEMHFSANQNEFNCQGYVFILINLCCSWFDLYLFASGLEKWHYSLVVFDYETGEVEIDYNSGE